MKIQHRSSLCAAAVVGAASMTGWWILDALNVRVGFTLPDVIYYPFFITFLIVIPLGSIVLQQQRLRTAFAALQYNLVLGASFCFILLVSQYAEYGFWKGMDPQNHSLAQLINREGRTVLFVLAVFSTMGMITWGFCRIFRRPNALNSGPSCTECGYDLTGNVSGICPECGTKI